MTYSFIPSYPHHPRSPRPVVKADKGRTVTITKDELEGERVVYLFIYLQCWGFGH